MTKSVNVLTKVYPLLDTPHGDVLILLVLELLKEVTGTVIYMELQTIMVREPGKDITKILFTGTKKCLNPAGKSFN